MKIKYDEVIIFKSSKDLTEKMESKAYEKGQTVSDYLRGLIVKDVKEQYGNIVEGLPTRCL